MVAQVFLAEDLMEQVRSAVHDQMLIREFEGGIDASQQLQHAQAIEGAVSVMDGLQDLDRTFSRRLIALLHRQPAAEFPFHVADVARRHQQVAGPHAQVEVTFFLFRKRNAEVPGSLFRTHVILLSKCPGYYQTSMLTEISSSTI